MASADAIGKSLKKVIDNSGTSCYNLIKIKRERRNGEGRRPEMTEMRIWNELETAMREYDIVFYKGEPHDKYGFGPLPDEEVQEKLEMGAKVYFFEDLQ